MDPERVLERTEDKDTISVLEAERAILASLLHAEREQAKKHPGSVEETFGYEYSEREIEDFLRSEFKDLVYDVKGKKAEVTPDMLGVAMERLNERVGIDAWDDDVVEAHKERCDTIVQQSKKGGR